MQELLHRLREHVGCLYQLCEVVSELDLLVSFAQVSSADKFVQPSFGDEMKLEASRHPILDVISPSTPQPNSVVRLEGGSRIFLREGVEFAGEFGSLGVLFQKIVFFPTSNLMI